MAKAIRSGNPARRAAAAAPSPVPVRQTRPVDYIDQPLPGVTSDHPAVVSHLQDARSRYAVRLEYLDALHAAGQALEAAQVELDARVSAARSHGLSWADIGDTLGLDRETARRRWTH